MTDLTNQPLLALIRDRGLIDDMQLEEVLGEHTRSGRPIAAVLVDYDVFHDLLDELEIRRAIAESEVSIREGRGIPNEVVMQELRERYGL